MVFINDRMDIIDIIDILDIIDITGIIDTIHIIVTIDITSIVEIIGFINNMDVIKGFARCMILIFELLLEIMRVCFKHIDPKSRNMIYY